MRARFFVLLPAAAAVAVTFLQCVSDDGGAQPAGGAGERCFANGTCLSGLVCTDGGCTTEGGDAESVPTDEADAARVPGCPVGAEKKRAFLTSVAYLANDLQGAPGKPADLCTALAADAGIGGAWEGWISSASSSAITRIDRGVEYVSLDGQRLFRSAAQLQDAGPQHLDHGIEVTERCLPVLASGDPAKGREVWTGTLARGLAIDGGVSTCDGWTASIPTSFGIIGQAGATDARWSELRRDGGCQNVRRPIYCFER